MEIDPARSLAERIARKVSAGKPAQLPPSAQLGAEIAAVRASISDLKERLAELESQASHDATTTPPTAINFAPPTHSPWLAGVNATTHASEERFGVEEAVINELVDYFQSEKPCSLEPGGRPCDHCAMCSSRGF